MKNAQVQSFIDKIRDDLAAPIFPIDGFSFSLDDPNKFDPYSWEAASACDFYSDEGMPRVEGFFYLSDEYETYLDVLKKPGMDHLANVETLPWAIIG